MFRKISSEAWLKKCFHPMVQRTGDPRKIGRSHRSTEQPQNAAWTVPPNKASLPSFFIRIFLPAATARRSLTTKLQCMQRWRITQPCVYIFYIVLYMYIEVYTWKLFEKPNYPLFFMEFHPTCSFRTVRSILNILKLVQMIQLTHSHNIALTHHQNSHPNPASLRSRVSWTSADSWLP